MLTNSLLLKTNKLKSIIILNYHQTQNSKYKYSTYYCLNQYIQIYHSKLLFILNLMIKLNTKLKKLLTKTHETIILLNKKNT